jgi:hypothetical protein
VNRLAAIIVAALLASVALQVARERWYPDAGSPVDEVYFTSGSAATTVALSFKSVLADIYWIRAIQYFAATRLKDKPTGPRDLLFPLLDITTSLDPQFNLAYRFGAIFLAERHQGGAMRPDLAIKLLDKGFAQNPTRWEYLYDKAFVYYWTFRDLKAAAHWFGEAAKVPGSADWLPGLAAIMLVEGGDRRSSRFLFQQMLQTAEHEYMRKNAEFRLAQLDILDAIDQLNAMVDRYEQITGARPTTWAPLVERNWLRASPADPAGTPFIIDSHGRAALDPSSKYNPLPIEPESTRPPGPGDDSGRVRRPPS